MAGGGAGWDSGKSCPLLGSRDSGSPRDGAGEEVVVLVGSTSHLSRRSEKL